MSGITKYKVVNWVFSFALLFDYFRRFFSRFGFGKNVKRIRNKSVLVRRGEAGAERGMNYCNIIEVSLCKYLVLAASRPFPEKLLKARLV